MSPSLFGFETFSFALGTELGTWIFTPSPTCGTVPSIINCSVTGLGTWIFTPSPTCGTAPSIINCSVTGLGTRIFTPSPTCYMWYSALYY